MTDKSSFGQAYSALKQTGITVGAVDHGMGWAMYFDDPDGTGLELYWDTRRQPGGRDLWHGNNVPIDEQGVLKEHYPGQ
ncbi:MAG: hypothetical protein NVS2B7_13410 [Herpetosiphon sp.]